MHTYIKYAQLYIYICTPLSLSVCMYIYIYEDMCMYKSVALPPIYIDASAYIIMLGFGSFFKK